MAYRKKSRSYRSRSGSSSSYSKRRTSRTRKAYRVRSGGGSRTIRLQIVQQAPQPAPMAIPGVGMVMPGGPPGKAPF